MAQNIFSEQFRKTFSSPNGSISGSIDYESSTILNLQGLVALRDNINITSLTLWVGSNNNDTQILRQTTQDVMGSMEFSRLNVNYEGKDYIKYSIVISGYDTKTDYITISGLHHDTLSLSCSINPISYGATDFYFIVSNAHDHTTNTETKSYRLESSNYSGKVSGSTSNLFNTSTTLSISQISDVLLDSTVSSTQTINITLKGYSVGAGNTPNSSNELSSNNYTFTLQGPTTDGTVTFSFIAGNQFQYNKTCTPLYSSMVTLAQSGGQNPTHFSLQIMPSQLNTGHTQAQLQGNTTVRLKALLGGDYTTITFGTRYAVSLLSAGGFLGGNGSMEVLQTAVETGSYPVQFVFNFYNSSSGGSAMQTIIADATFIGNIKALSSIHTEVFKDIPKNFGLNMTVPGNETHIDSNGSQAGIIRSSIEDGQLYNTTYVNYPCTHDSNNTDYHILCTKQEAETCAIIYKLYKNCNQTTTKAVVSFRAIAENTNEQESLANINVLKIENDSGTSLYDIDIEAESENEDNPEYHEYTIYGDFSVQSDNEIGLVLNVGYYGAAICGFTVKYYYNASSKSVNQPLAITTYGNYNSSGNQPVQVWPPIYDVTLSNLTAENKPYIYETGIYLATTYSYNTSTITTNTQYIKAPIGHSAESPNTSITGNIYAGSGQTGTIDYKLGNANTYPHIDTTYIGTYLTCYVNAKAESSEQSDTKFCRIRLRTMYGDAVMGQSYITNTTHAKYTIVDHEWIDRSEWNSNIAEEGLYVEMGVAHYGGNINGISTYVEYVKNKHIDTFLSGVERYGGPVIEDSNSYTYLRANALKLTCGTTAFQSSSPSATNYPYSTSSYTPIYFGNNTADTLYYNGSSYTLFLKSNYYTSGKIPPNSYTYTSYDMTLTPYNFGYYFCGYFELPNTYAVGSSSGARNYTGTNLVDFDASTYISRYRFKQISGNKRWNTTRSFLNSFRDTFSSNITRSFTNYSKAKFILSSSSTFTVYFAEDKSGSMTVSSSTTSQTSTFTFPWLSGGFENSFSASIDLSGSTYTTSGTTFTLYTNTQPTTVFENSIYTNSSIKCRVLQAKSSNGNRNAVLWENYSSASLSANYRNPLSTYVTSRTFYIYHYGNSTPTDRNCTMYLQYVGSVTVNYSKHTWRYQVTHST